MMKLLGSAMVALFGTSLGCTSSNNESDGIEPATGSDSTTASGDNSTGTAFDSGGEGEQGSSGGAASDGSGGTDNSNQGSGGSTGGGPAFPDVTAAPSAGCGGSHAPPSGTLSMTVDGLERTYIVSLPENYDSAQAYPVVFAFHGLGGSGDLVSGPWYFGLEEEEGAPSIFVYPDGLDVQNGGGAGWDNQGGRDVAFFDAMLTEFKTAYCIDQNRVFSTGHSYGGIMTHTLACERGDVLRAVAPVAGGRWSHYLVSPSRWS